MNFFEILSNVLIRPLELVFELIYSVAYILIGNPGVAIIFLSLAINILVLPLYKKADAMQELARQTDKRLHPWVTHIKKNFTGDERYMILQTYYRQNHYKPTDALRGSVSLLLEVPFFMAAYQFLSGLEMLQGISFGPIANLALPDGMLTVGVLNLNLLPILMTLINLVSGYIYTKGFPLKDKLQLYGMALVFLVLLYDSPAGLVFYWTLNNVFSLVKNIFAKLKNPRKILAWICSACGIALSGYFLFLQPLGICKRQLLVQAMAVMLQLPLAGQLFHRGGKVSRKEIRVSAADRHSFFLGCSFLCLLLGLLIPTTLIGNSPAEFVNVEAQINPAVYILNVLSISLGMLIVWPAIFYMLAGPAVKKAMGLCVWLLSGAAVVDYMFFGKDYGNLSPNLKFDLLPQPASSEILLNLLVLAAVLGALLLIYRKKKELASVGYIAAILAVTGMSLIHLPGIYEAGRTRIAEIQKTSLETPSIPLSRQGKNVMVLMMDRAIGLNIPFILQEKPEIRDQFSGFVYYPKTLSHGINTNIGSPALAGGYEYRPEQMNLRGEETLEQKHDEALKVMPDLFYHAGYEVTLWDPPLAGYDVIPMQQVFEDYPGMHVSNTLDLYARAGENMAPFSLSKAVRDLYCYSILKASPVAVQPVIYAQGAYNDPDELYRIQMLKGGVIYEEGQYLLGRSRSVGLNPIFMASYRELEALPELTEVQDGEKNTFLFLANNVPHENMLLQTPDYTPSMTVDNTRYDAAHEDRFTWKGYTMDTQFDYQMANYHSNMAYMLKLGQWFDYLKEQGVYDNTRIIVAADHGRDMYHFQDLMFESRISGDILHFNPVLLVKDFGSQEPFSMDLTFMTNGDVPSLAMEGLIENPVNPFTGNPINMDPKQEPQIVLDSYEHSGKNNTPFYLPACWYRINGDLFDASGWEQLGEPDILPQH